MDHPERIESWRPFPDWEGWYDVSDKGRARSLDRVVTCCNGSRRFYPGQILALWPDLRGGYPHASLRRPGVRLNIAVHTMVLIAFDRPPRPGEECRHGPRGPAFNWWPEDIRWGTYAENEADKIRDGTRVRGAAIPWAKLTEAIVLDCRRRRADGELVIDLAAEYRVSKATMSRAIRGVGGWGWLTDDDAVAGQ